MFSCEFKNGLSGPAFLLLWARPSSGRVQNRRPCHDSLLICGLLSGESRPDLDQDFVKNHLLILLYRVSRTTTNWSRVPPTFSSFLLFS